MQMSISYSVIEMYSTNLSLFWFGSAPHKQHLISRNFSNVPNQNKNSFSFHFFTDTREKIGVVASVIETTSRPMFTLNFHSYSLWAFDKLRDDVKKQHRFKCLSITTFGRAGFCCSICIREIFICLFSLFSTFCFLIFSSTSTRKWKLYRRDRLWSN